MTTEDPKLNLDPSWFLPITGIFEKASFTFTLLRFVTGTTRPEDWPSYLYTLSIGALESGVGLFSLTVANGELVITNNLMVVSCTAPQNKMIYGKKYFYNLVSDRGNGLIVPEGRGTIAVKPLITPAP